MSPRDASTVKDAERDAMLVVCRLNSDCAPGLYCKDEVCTFDCRVDRDCAPGLECQSGACLSPAPAEDMRVVEDRPDAAPPPDAMVDRCAEVVCDPDERCDVATGECRPRALDCEPGGCGEGFECDLPSGRCVEVMAPDCNQEGCPEGQRCVAGTGLCEAAGEGEIGVECERGADCESGICADVNINRVQHTVCASLCCTENDCPIGYGCRDLGGARMCLPSRIFPAGYTFDRSAGQTCGATGNGCRSGLCDQDADACLALCCTDQDCGGRMCVWRRTLSGNRAICDINVLGFGRTGDGCASEFDCQSQICVPNPTPNPAPGLCADFCCSNDDCPNGFSCGQVIGPMRNIVSACTPHLGGAAADGAACVSDDGCASSTCVEGICRAPCCADLDCAGDLLCRPRITGEADGFRRLIKVCAED